MKTLLLTWSIIGCVVLVQILSEAAPVTEPDLGKAIVENCSKLNLSDDAKLLVKKAVDDALALAKKEKCDKPETARRVLKAAGDALEKSGIKGIGDRIEADGKKAIENATKTKVSPSKQDIIATKNKSKNGHGPVPSKPEIAHDKSPESSGKPDGNKVANSEADKKTKTKPNGQGESSS